MSSVFFCVLNPRECDSTRQVISQRYLYNWCLTVFRLLMTKEILNNNNLFSGIGKRLSGWHNQVSGFFLWKSTFVFRFPETCSNCANLLLLVGNEYKHLFKTSNKISKFCFLLFIFKKMHPMYNPFQNTSLPNGNPAGILIFYKRDLRLICICI